jgi:hypothetical protein
MERKVLSGIYEAKPWSNEGGMSEAASRTERLP